MNTRDLKYLVALSEYRHFGKAAEACFVSQPALSMQIKKLEEHLGVTLLERSNKSVLLTEIGITIAAHARIVLQQVIELQDAAKMAIDPYQGELKIGIIPTLSPYLLPLLIPKLAKHFPKVSFYLVEEQTALLMEKLKNGLLDAAFFAAPILEDAFTETPLFTEEFLLAVSLHHTLAKQKSIQQHDLKHEPLLLLAEGHCMRDQTLAVCHWMKTTETQNFRATSLETLRQMVIAGVGMTLMPKLALKSEDKIAYIPFHAPKPSRQIGLYWRNTSAKTVLLQDLSAQIKKILAKEKAITLL